MDYLIAKQGKKLSSTSDCRKLECSCADTWKTSCSVTHESTANKPAVYENTGMVADEQFIHRDGTVMNSKTGVVHLMRYPAKGTYNSNPP